MRGHFFAFLTLKCTSIYRTCTCRVMYGHFLTILSSQDSLYSKTHLLWTLMRVHTLYSKSRLLGTLWWEDTLRSGDTFSEWYLIFPMLRNLSQRDTCHVYIGTASSGYRGVPLRQVILYYITSTFSGNILSITVVCFVSVYVFTPLVSIMCSSQVSPWLCVIQRIPHFTGNMWQSSMQTDKPLSSVVFIHRIPLSRGYLSPGDNYLQGIINFLHGGHLVPAETYLQMTPLFRKHLSSGDASLQETPLFRKHLSSGNTSLQETPLFRRRLSSGDTSLQGTPLFRGHPSLRFPWIPLHFHGVFGLHFHGSHVELCHDFHWMPWKRWNFTEFHGSHGTWSGWELI